MSKDQKKASKSKKSAHHKPKKGLSSPAAGSAWLAPWQTVRDLGHQVSRLSTGQQVVGGLALLAAGFTYWAKQRPRGTSATSQAAAPMAAPAPAQPEGSETARKSGTSRKKGSTRPRQA